MLEAFILEYYGSAPSVPPQIVVPRAVGETDALAEFLTERRGSRVEVRAPERGEKRRLQELATQNARVALASEAAAAEQKRLRRVEALEELREALNLEALPLRIECYDISNIQEESAVGSMVVFQDARRRRRRTTGSSGSRAGRARTTSQRSPRWSPAGSPGCATWPTRSTTSRSRLHRTWCSWTEARGSSRPCWRRCRRSTCRASRSSRSRSARRRCSCPDRPDPIVLDRHSAGLQLLQRIRDEAHRFALGFHRQRRDSKARESIFDTLQGVGPARRRALLRHFGSAERFLAASQEELEGVAGMPQKTARSIYAQLHKAGRA